MGVAALFTVMVAGVAVADPAPTHPAELSWGDCPFTVDRAVRCGRLEVPENRDKPNGRGIVLRFAVIPAAERRADDIPVAFLTGGPGFSAFASLKVLSRIPFNRNRDVILLDPRGYGYSEPWLNCAGIAAMPACYADTVKAGIDVEQYTTAASVEDYEDLRKSLGHRQWHILGASYGTFWASLYARMYPQSIRSIVMDSPYPLNAGYDWTRVSTLNAFERMFNACRADAACDSAFPQLRQKFIDTLRRLKAEPATVAGKALDHIDAFKPVYGTLYLSHAFARTPMMIDALARADYDTFQRLASQARFDLADGFDRPRAGAIGLNAAVFCKEDIFFPAAIETRVAFHAPWPADIVKMITPEGWDYGQRCAAWPVARAAPEINEPVTSDIPTLVLVGAYDPITPPEFAEAMLLHLTRGTLAVDPSAAHALFMDDHPCVHDIMTRFYDNPDETPDISCLMRSAPVRWALPTP